MAKQTDCRDQRPGSIAMFIVKLAVLCITSLTVLVMIAGGLWLVYKVITLSPGLPTVAQITKKRPVMSEIFDRNGLKIGEIGLVKHEHIDYDDLPPMVPKATTAAEDQRFFDHSGIDYIGTLRAGAKSALAGRMKQGGSSITQQVAKNYLLSSAKSYDRKISEMIIAKRLEEKYSKREILELYLNIVNYGDGRIGIETGCKHWFGHSIRQASLAEIAFLVGIHPSPTKYNPRNHFDAAKRQQEHVLGRMRKEKMITEAEYASAVAEKIKIVSDRDEDAKTGQEIIDLVSDRLMEIFKGDKEEIKMLGWKIYTTIDIKLQAIVKEQLRNGLLKIGGAEGAVIIMNSEREVLVMVGGPNYKPGGMNNALKAWRQPGSTFKGLVYAAGFEAGKFTPETVFSNVLTTYKNNTGPDWPPDNYRGEASETPFFTVRNAYAESLNRVAARAICGLWPGSTLLERGEYSLASCREYGLVRQTIALAEKAGIKWSEKDPPHENPSIALGATSVTPIGLLGAYMAIAHDRYYREPGFIMRIEGEGTPQLPNRESVEVVTEQTLRYMQTLTNAVVEEGTGRKARGRLPETAYGKTGTTDKSTNAWFVGGTDSYWGAVWMGHKNQNRPLGKDVTGASAALPVWIDAINACYGRESNMVKAMRQKPKQETEEAETEAPAASEPQPQTEGASAEPSSESSEAASAATSGVDDIPADDTTE